MPTKLLYVVKFGDDSLKGSSAVVPTRAVRLRVGVVKPISQKLQSYIVQNTEHWNYENKSGSRSPFYVGVPCAYYVHLHVPWMYYVRVQAVYETTELYRLQVVYGQHGNPAYRIYRHWNCERLWFASVTATISNGGGMEHGREGGREGGRYGQREV